MSSAPEILVLVLIFALAIVLIVLGRVAARRGRPGRGELPGEPPAGAGPSSAVLEPPAVTTREAPPTEAGAPEAPPVGAQERVVEEPVVEPVAPVKPRLRDRLGKTRAAFGGALSGLVGRGKVDSETWEELEEALILADVGVATTTRILDDVQARAKEERVTDPGAVIGLLRAELLAVLETGARDLDRAPDGITVWMFVGVNGVGKTTTIAKLAQLERAEGRAVVLAAADTFRAAAAEQLTVWGERVGAQVIRGQEGADPGSVVFDAMSAAANRDADIVLVDTAGRLHTKVNLMEELKKLRRIVDRTPGALREVLLVIDASTGQNGLTQARQFTEAVDVTGVVLTKLDGTAKGGIVLAIQSELGIPVKAVGLGESAADLVTFDPAEFVEALLP